MTSHLVRATSQSLRMVCDIIKLRPQGEKYILHAFLKDNKFGFNLVFVVCKRKPYCQTVEVFLFFQKKAYTAQGILACNLKLSLYIVRVVRMIESQY